LLTRKDHQHLFWHNGFHIFRNAIPADEARDLARFVKAGYGVEEMDLFTRADIVNQVPELTKYIHDPRIVERVKMCVGDDVCFVQQSDFHANYVAHGWHRDSANREFGIGRDWDESEAPYQVVKAMFYLEGQDIALAILPRSHRMNVPPTDNWPDFNSYQVLPRANVLEVPLYEDGNVHPILVEGGPGDLLVFDIRLLHGGRVLDPVYAQLHEQLAHPKSQVAIVYGTDNIHSRRFYSYTRFVREDMGYKNVGEHDLALLKEHSLLLPHMNENLFDTAPQEAEGIVEFKPINKLAGAAANGE